MEKLILKLKEDFYVRLGLIPTESLSEADPTFSLLTEEELEQLELAWIELALWQEKQNR